MTDDLPPAQRPELPAAGQPSSLPTQDEEIQAVNSREALLLRARRIARGIQDRVWRVLGRETLQGPHAGQAGRAQPESRENPVSQEAPPAAPPRE